MLANRMEVLTNNILRNAAKLEEKSARSRKAMMKDSRSKGAPVDGVGNELIEQGIGAV